MKNPPDPPLETATSGVRKTAIYLFIFSFLALQIGLILSAYSRDEKSFGWRMFSDAVVYRIELFATDAKGIGRPLGPNEYRPFLRDKARVYFDPAAGYRIFARGENYLFKECGRLSQFLCARLSRQGCSEVEVRVEYRTVRSPEMKLKFFKASCA